MRKPLPLLSLFIAALFTLPLIQETAEWVLRKEKNGIKVYTRRTQKSKIKEVRMTLETKASLSNIISLLNDTEAYTEWAYRFKESKTLEKINDRESIYYGSVDFPWPLADRDIVARSIIDQDPHTKVVTIKTTALPGYLPEKKNHVRITEHVNEWRFAPQPNGTVQIEYELSSNPAGHIPAWVINLALDQGSSQSMEAFLDRLPAEKYRNAELAFIEEL